MRWTAALTFSGGNRSLVLGLVGSDVNHGDTPMTFMAPFASRLSVVAAYVAFAVVGAIVFGIF